MSAEETSLCGGDLFRDHHMLVQLVGFMKEVNVSKSSKVTLAVIISRVLVLWLYKTVTLLNLCWVIFARSCSGWIDVEDFAGEIIGGTIAHQAPMLRGQYNLR